ncbi:MAG: PD40 domain-containing protein [Planctomycetes bacterium]|nr:PD40 domain-containing protein [Planctomycetota bacterium]
MSAPSRLVRGGAALALGCVSLLAPVGCRSVGDDAAQADPSSADARASAAARPSDAFVRDGEGGWKVLHPGAGHVVPADAKLPGETHLANVRMLTFAGQNAEAYWSFDDRELIFQATVDDLQCDQIFLMDVASGAVRQVTHEGRTTCPFFIPGTDRILFASTQADGPDCPPEPDRSQGYVWALYDYDIYTADRDGGRMVNITNTPGYDAEGTISPQGRVVFTSDRSGDLELYTMEPDGSDVRRLTDRPGYDGGAFFSPDGSKIVWRASRFDSEQELSDYRELLKQHMVRPSKMEIWIADADGSNPVQLTDNGKANFAPYFTPDGEAVVFASNMADPKGRVFEIWKVTIADKSLEQVTFNGESFDGFPMFSWDGKRVAFCSNRNGAQQYDTNVFVADWLP